MTIFFILIFLEVRVINLYSTTFHHFFVQTQPPNLPKHDIANSEFHVCIKEEFIFCEDAKNQEKFGFCILRISEHCLINQRHLNDPYYRAARYFLNFCWGNKSKHPLHFLGLILLKCYKNHPKRHFSIC